MTRFLLEFLNFFSFAFWNLSSAEVSLCKSIFDLDEDFDSKEDLLLYFIAIQQQQQKKSFPENHFPQEKSYKDYFNI